MVRIIVLSLLIPVTILGFKLSKWGIIDSSMWSNQAEYVLTNNLNQFDFSQAYGHPGGTIVEGLIFINRITNISFEDSLVIFLTLIGALLIAGVSILSYKITNNKFVWFSVLGLLTLNKMNDFVTPPSFVVSLSLLFLCIFTLYICLNKQVFSKKTIFFWVFIAGFSLATRLDISLIIIFSLLIILKLNQKINWPQLFYILFGLVVVFSLLNPFMWFMPIQHIKDLVYKITFHYSEYYPTYLRPSEILDFSILTFLSMFLSAFLIFKREKIASPIPINFLVVMLLITAFLYNVFLTARYQAPRYFKPLILIWETFLPIFIFSLLPLINFEFLKKEKSKKIALNIVSVFVVIILISYYLIYMWSAYSNSFSYVLA